MANIYLRECLFENVGPIEFTDISLSLNGDGTPRPVILVGKNGTGKTIVLSHVIDALTEFAKKSFRDIVPGDQIGFSPLVKRMSTTDTRSLSGTSLALLEFADDEKHEFDYVEKIGSLAHGDYAGKLRGRFHLLPSWPTDEVLHKNVSGEWKAMEAFLTGGAVCFFPSSRHERPHWLNTQAVTENRLFSDDSPMMGELKKPLIVERAAERNRRWLIDVMMDSLMDVDILPADPSLFIPAPSIQPKFGQDLRQKELLQISRRNVEALLRQVLEDDRAELLLSHRGSPFRLAIRLGTGIIIPSLEHLSAGQSLLFNMFSTVVRYADRSDIGKSITLGGISGIVIIDEVEAHLHTDLQYTVLPRLFRLFPKVQFIVTSHSPLFLLGMEREFGPDGVTILELPSGREIGTERFEEFQRSWNFYRETRSFEGEVERKVLAAAKPLVLTEGQTDALYIETALDLLGHTDLLSQVEISAVGQPGQEGSKGSGQGNLDIARKFLEHNQGRFPRRVLLLYDSDTKKEARDLGSVSIRRMGSNPENTKVRKGVENLLPASLFDDRFYEPHRETMGDGGEKIVKTLRKADFCGYVCKERRVRDDFEQFDRLVVPIIQEFLRGELGHSESKGSVPGDPTGP